MYHTIDVADVLYFRADTKYIMLHLAGKEVLYTGTLKKIKEDNPHLMMITPQHTGRPIQDLPIQT